MNSELREAALLPVRRQTHRLKAQAGKPKMFQEIEFSEEGGCCGGKLSESHV